MVGPVTVREPAARCSSARSINSMLPAKAELLVRAITGADAKGQHLPKALSGAPQPIDELIGSGSEIAGAVRAGQGGWMEKNTTGAG